MSKWQARFLDLAHHISQWSKDPSTKVGAVIVRSKKVVGMGYNGFPNGVADTAQRLNDRPTKYNLVIHAEANAILDAGRDAQGATLYCTLAPCNECAKLIIQAGIKHVVFVDMHDRLVGAQMLAEEMFREAGVTWASSKIEN